MASINGALHAMHPMQWQMLETELADIVGWDHVLTEEIDRLPYAVDIFWLPRMYLDRGQVPPLPDVVVLPGSVDEVSRVLKLANVYRVPVVPWGGGSGSQGGVMPVYGGITLDLKRLNKRGKTAQEDGNTSVAHVPFLP